MKKLLFLIAVAASFSSCLEYGRNVMQSQVPLSQDSCNQTAKNILLFFAGEPIYFPYEKKCLVEVVGTQFSTDQELLNRLKNQAYMNCSNAILNVSVRTIVRESGYVGDNKYKHIYSAKVYSGLAVKLNEEDYKRSGDWQDESFKSAVAGYQQKQENEAGFKIFATTLTAIVCIIYYISKT